MEESRDEMSVAIALANLSAVSNNPYMTRPPIFLQPQPISLMPSPNIRVHGLDRRTLTRMSKSKKKNFEKRNFAEKLFDMLQSGYHSDIAKWIPGGGGFMIIDKKRFANEILPIYFKESQYTSFTRKLSRWQFKRVARGPYVGAYYHERFRSDNRSLCRAMSCNNSKNIKVDKVESCKEAALPPAPVSRPHEKEATKMPEAKESNPPETDPPGTIDLSSSPPPPPVPPKSGNRPPRKRHVDLNLDNSMLNNDDNRIRQQIIAIRLHKARLAARIEQERIDREEQLKLLMIMQAEKEHRARALLRNAVDASIRQATEKCAIASAVRELDMRTRNNAHDTTALMSALLRNETRPPNQFPQQYYQQQEFNSRNDERILNLFNQMNRIP
jgi:hypothetical protein